MNEEIGAWTSHARWQREKRVRVPKHGVPHEAELASEEPRIFGRTKLRYHRAAVHDRRTMLPNSTTPAGRTNLLSSSSRQSRAAPPSHVAAGVAAMASGDAVISLANVIASALSPRRRVSNNLLGFEGRSASDLPERSCQFPHQGDDRLQRLLCLVTLPRGTTREESSTRPSASEAPPSRGGGARPRARVS